MEKIVVIGGGGHAKVIISLLKKIGSYSIQGYTDNKNLGNILGIKYLGNDEILPSVFNEGCQKAVIGIGQIKTSDIRKKIIKKLKDVGFIFPTIISPNAIINEEVIIGEGTVIMDGVIINSGTRIGSFSIINTKSSIDHDCFIGDFTHIAPGVTLSGGVEVGRNILIGTGASIVQSRKVVDESIIAAGSVVTSNILTPGTYIGVPARLMPTKKEFR